MRVSHFERFLGPCKEMPLSICHIGNKNRMSLFQPSCKCHAKDRLVHLRRCCVWWWIWRVYLIWLIWDCIYSSLTRQIKPVVFLLKLNTQSFSRKINLFWKLQLFLLTIWLCSLRFCFAFLKTMSGFVYASVAIWFWVG